jgi:hypothetical protein
VNSKQNPTSLKTKGNLDRKYFLGDSDEGIESLESAIAKEHLVKTMALSTQYMRPKGNLSLHEKRTANESQCING